MREKTKTTKMSKMKKMASVGLIVGVTTMGIVAPVSALPGDLGSIHVFAASSPVMTASEATAAGYVWTDNGDGTAMITEYNGTDKTLAIPSEIDGLAVTGIHDGDFNNGYYGVFSDMELTSIIIPDSITKIGTYAFNNNQLTSVIIPGGVTEIGAKAFSNNKLTSVTISDGVTKIGSSAFRNNQLTDVTIPNSVNIIDGYAFDNNQLTSVMIPDGVTEIGYNAFAYNKLTSITIPDSVTNIGSEAFWYNQITDLTIPNSVTYVGENAFAHNPLTGNIVLPEHIPFSKDIFNYNALPITAEDFDYEQTADGLKLTAYTGGNADLVIPSEINGEPVTAIGSYFHTFELNSDANPVTGLTSVTIPDSVTTIGANAFNIGNFAYAEPTIDKVTLGNNVTSIGEKAFKNQMITEIVIPESVKTIGDYAFGGNELSEVTIASATTTIGAHAFRGNQSSPASLVMYAPDPSIAKTFANNKGYSFLPYVEPASEPEGPTVPEGSLASSDNAGFNLGAGLFELTTSKIKSFGNIQMPATMTQYTTSFEAPFNVKDFSGKQAGWRVDVSASQFEIVAPESGFAEGTGAYKLPIGTLELSPLKSITRVSQGTSGMPTSELAASTIIDDGTVTVVSAAKGEGMGEFDLTFPEEALTLTLNPETAKIDTVNYPNAYTPYEATVSWDLVQAP